MAYNFVKLNEVELTDSPYNPNFLVEDDGDIKRVPAEAIVVAGVQSDWDEEDENSPAYILNKPEDFGGQTVFYVDNSGSIVYEDDGSPVTPLGLLEDFSNGNVKILNENSSGGSCYTVLNIEFSYASGGHIQSATGYYLDNGNTIKSFQV